jgi:hypothetical protein
VHRFFGGASLRFEAAVLIWTADASRPTASSASGPTSPDIAPTELGYRLHEMVIEVTSGMLPRKFFCPRRRRRAKATAQGNVMCQSSYRLHPCMGIERIDDVSLLPVANDRTGTHGAHDHRQAAPCSFVRDLRATLFMGRQCEDIGCRVYASDVRNEAEFLNVRACELSRAYPADIIMNSTRYQKLPFDIGSFPGLKQQVESLANNAKPDEHKNRRTIGPI